MPYRDTLGVRVQMGKVNSIAKILALYIFIFALAAVLLSVLTYTVCSYSSNRIERSYPFEGERYYLTNASGERLGEGALIGSGREPLDERDERTVRFLELFPIIMTPVYSALAIFASALLFYKNRLKRPVDMLLEAAGKISESNLDFSIKYESGDEMGLLCKAFEKMRLALSETLKEAWRQTEDRKRINAAFAHDIRTPLTVLKGYGEILAHSEDTKTRETAMTMERNILKIEKYSAEMARLSRMEDMEPKAGKVEAGELFYHISESARLVCEKEGKRLCAACEGDGGFFDEDFICEAVQNIISNAARYAKSEVSLKLSFKGGGLCVFIGDDGSGFDREALSRACDAYYTKDAKNSHFGLGLYISRLLCEKHGGYLKIENDGGARVTAFFKNGEKSR